VAPRKAVKLGTEEIGKGRLLRHNSKREKMNMKGGGGGRRETGVQCGLHKALVPQHIHI
jgi:hypothetical protein